MTKEDTIKVLSVLKAAYPNSYKGISVEEAQGVVNLWMSHLTKVPGDIVQLALNKWIASNQFPPTIADIKKKIGAIHYEAVGELMMSDNISPKKKEMLNRIIDSCREVDKEPRLKELMGIDRWEAIEENEAYDIGESNMPLLQARR